jgi:hypothetical protein
VIAHRFGFPEKPLQPFGMSQPIPWYWAPAALLVLWRVLMFFTEP